MSGDIFEMFDDWRRDMSWDKEYLCSSFHSPLFNCLWLFLADVFYLPITVLDTPLRVGYIMDL